MANAKSDAPKPPETPATPPPAPDTAPAAGKVTETTAADIVAGDKDIFPDSHAGGSGEGHEPEPPLEGERPSRNLGGRPKGSRDKEPRGRPKRRDWADEPMHPRRERQEGDPEPEPTPDPEPTPQPEQEPKRPADYKGLATFAVDMTTGGMAGLLGPHWQCRPAPGPGLPDEREMLIGHLTKYLEENEIKDIPPGVLLGISVAGYVIPRVILEIKMRRSKAPRVVSPPRAPTPEKKQGDAPAAHPPPVAAERTWPGKPAETQAPPRDLGESLEDEPA
jgi:hypothetical protein